MPTVEIDLNEHEITKTIRKAKLPMFAKKMAVRMLALCVQKDNYRLWFNLAALRKLRKSALTSDAYDALNRLKQAGIIEWRREGDDVVVGFRGWDGRNDR